MREFVVIFADVVGVLFFVLFLVALFVSFLPSPSVRKLLKYLRERGFIKRDL